MNKKEFAHLLLEWYVSNKRNLPWRKTKDPYKIWLSEIMLQQTRVNQGLPYYLSFVKKYPTVTQLAKAHEQEVLRMWQGLGYYSRARNLHKCAKLVSKDFDGRFPGTVADLKKLPGIGDYTGAAIASLAFGQPSAVVDGNVFRVLSRLFGIHLNIASNEGKKYFFELANNLIPQDNPGEFNQAMMEFGAIHCMPKNPKCESCAFTKSCVANQKGTQSLLPVKSKMKKRKVRYFNYFIIGSEKKIWMKPRVGKDIWEGLHEFYLIESSRLLSDAKALYLFDAETRLQNKKPTTKSIRIRQILSHQEIVGKFFSLEWHGSISPPKPNTGKFYSLKQIERLAKPVIILDFLKSRTNPTLKKKIL
jgi:A/G-specific adenine glycosylase